MRLSSCSRVTGNCSMTSSMLNPASRFSNRTFTGVRVPRSTHAPLTLPGMLSTAGHCDQSRVAIFLPYFYGSLNHVSPVALTYGRRERVMLRVFFVFETDVIQ